MDRRVTVLPVMALRCHIKDRIELVIEAWADEKQNLPFTAKEQFVMALLCNDAAMTLKQIIRWLFNRFAHYRTLAFEGYYGLCDLFFDQDARDYVGHAEELYEQVARVPREFDMPLTVRYEGGLTRYSISAANGERLLSQVLGSRKSFSKSFPFFRLPAELRNVIYKLVFQYPESGLRYRGTPRPPSRYPEELLVQPLEEDVDHASLRGVDESLTLLKLAPIMDVLSPLLVSRQFHQEAMPYFFSINTFVFMNISALENFLTAVPLVHLQCTQQLSFNYRPKSEEGAIWVFSQLTKLKMLRKLTIRIDEQEWTRLGVSSQLEKYQSVANMPGVSTLGKIRGLEEATFVGCPSIEKMLKEDMLKPKPTKKGARRVGRKRKAEDAGEAVVTKRGGRAKKAKGA